MNSENIHKLVTKEDPYFIHKLFGLISLCNFIYRYYLLFAYGNMMFDTQIDMFMIAIHACLSLSSLIFHIPRKRHATLPMIYPEFRLHSILFGMRSIVCCFIEYYSDNYNKLYMKMSICFITMIIADYITKNYAEPGDTTMRAMPFAERIPDDYAKIITKYHSNSQVFATLMMLYNIVTAFSPLFAIQIAAFLMTLVRKNIIKPNTWHIVYSFSLMINIFTINDLKTSDWIIICLFKYLFSYMRMNLRINKYIGWMIIFFLHRIIDLTFIDLYDNLKYPIQVFMILYYLVVNIYIVSPLFYTK